MFLTNESKQALTIYTKWLGLVNHEWGDLSDDVHIADLKLCFENLDFFSWAESGSDSDKSRPYQLVKECLEICGDSFEDYDLYEFFEAVDKMENELSDDFYFDTPSGEVRLIAEGEIDEIWTDSLIEMVAECYDLSNIPNFIVIDWEATADILKIAGMGEHFASYDGEEHYLNGYYLFRTN